jgi:zinc and cadmium transporter
MSQVLILSLSSALFISLFSLVGAVSFGLSKNLISKLSIFLVAFSTGALLGGAFFHLLPEALTEGESIAPFVYLIIGISTFYLMERFLKWHHCHKDGKCEVHTFTYMSLFGDGVHNFIDGLVIVSAFHVSPEVGLATTIAVASHEIPQELGDFGILIHGGFSRAKAILWNLGSALTAVLGVLVGYFILNNIENFSLILLPFAAGGFIYISMSDLIPELHKENKLGKSFVTFLFFAIGLVFMYFMKILFE